MKAKFLILLISLLPLLSMAQNDANKVRVDVYYFHITNRCATCIAIEDNIRKTLNTYFAPYIQDSTVRLFVINCELPQNKAISEKYLAYGSTLAITKITAGKETIDDISGWAFQKIGKPAVFTSELKQKIEIALKP